MEIHFGVLIRHYTRCSLAVGTQFAGSYLPLIADIVEALPAHSSSIYSTSAAEVLKLADGAKV